MTSAWAGRRTTRGARIDKRYVWLSIEDDKCSLTINFINQCPRFGRFDLLVDVQFRANGAGTDAGGEGELHRRQGRVSWTSPTLSHCSPELRLLPHYPSTRHERQSHFGAVIFEGWHYTMATHPPTRDRPPPGGPTKTTHTVEEKNVQR